MQRIILLSILLIAGLAAQPADGQLLPFRSYSIENGLSESVVHDMIQGHNGYIWIATGYGLNRFDGIKFRNYYEEDGLSSNVINTLYEDREGQIWIGTGSGINVMSQDSIIVPESLKPLNSTSILEIFQDSNGDYWFATDGKGVWHLDSRDNLSQYTTVHGIAGDRVRDIIEDRDSTLWFGTREGLTSLKDGNFRSYTMEDGLPDNKVRDLELAANKNFWIATRGGLSYFQDGDFVNFTEEDGLINNRIQSLSVDHKGNIWIGTEEGASYFERGRFQNYSVEQGLSNNIIYATLFDREHNIWFGTFGGGISVFLGEKFANFTVEEGLPNNVITSITQDQKGDHWVSTYGGGIARYREGTFTIFNESDGLVDNKVYTIFVDSRNRLLIGTRWGLSIYDGEQFFNFNESELPYRKIRSITEVGSTGEYWLGTYGEGVLRYMNGSFSQYTEEQGLVNNTVLSVESDGESLWFATYGGVSHYQDGEFANYTVKDGLPNNGVLDILKDRQGNIWVTTFGGIARFENDRFIPITSDQGMPDELSYFMIQDNNGILWIGGNKGVIRFDYGEYRLLEGADRSSAFKLLTQDQGLIANEMNTAAGFRDQDGILWFGSVGGLSQFNPAFQKRNHIPPEVHIESIRVAGEIVSDHRDITISSGSKNILIEYIGINFRAPDQIIYEYRLKGSSRAWRQTNQREVRYSALLPGDYQFEVRAKNNDGVWSRERATVSFTVLAPFWLQWWFFVVIGLVMVGIVYFFYHYYKVRKMMEMERMRVRIASDLHDDVGSSLTEIALHSDFLQTTELDQSYKQSLNQIGNQCRRIVSSLDDIVWSIDARNDTLGDLTDRMQDYINNVLSDKQVQYHFDELDMEKKVTVPIKENIYLIFKEAVNNIAKHSNADHVDIKLTNKNGSFDLVIHDDGSGITPNARKTGHGLRNMQMRAQRIDADIVFSNGDGFTVHVSGNRS